MKVKKKLAQLNLLSKPSFLILGAQKAGTTSLFELLNQHTLIQGSVKKEIHYFDNDNLYNRKKISDYHLFFPFKYQLKKISHVFEATPSYLVHPEVARRLYLYNSELQFIVLLRNPVERAISAWIMYNNYFNENKNPFLYDPRNFDDVMRAEIDELKSLNRFIDNRCYLKRGMYHEQIEGYLKYFSISQFLFIESNDLKYNFEESYRKILNFLDLPFESLISVNSNKSKVVFKKENHQKIISELKTIFKPENQKLYDMIGRKFDWDD